MTFNIVFVLFDDVTQLDFTGPAQVLCRLPDATVHVAAKTLAPIRTDAGFSICPSVTFGDCPQADLICIPGGMGTAAAIEDDALMAFVKQQGTNAQYITSVCTGSLILGAAGFLKDRKATTHWSSISLLEICGATYTEGRVVQDGNLYTGGGVTAGIDFALTVVAAIRGDEVAQTIQLAMEYNPQPPFDSGHPSRAPEKITQRLSAFYEERLGNIGPVLEKALSE